MKASDLMIEFLDTLSDEDVLKVLDCLYGQDEPIWKECSEEEYKENYPNWVKLHKEKEPDHYKYYKQVGSKRIVIVNSQIMDYLNKRKINYDKRSIRFI